MAVMEIAWSCHSDHGRYFNVVRTLIIQPILLISAQMVGSLLIFKAEYLEQTNQKLPERHLLKWISLSLSLSLSLSFSKFQNYQNSEKL